MSNFDPAADRGRRMSLRNAVEAVPSDPELRKLLGWQLVMAGFPEEARFHAEASDDGAEARELVAAASAAMEGSPNLDRDAARRRIGQVPDDPASRIALVRILRVGGLYEEAAHHEEAAERLGTTEGKDLLATATDDAQGLQATPIDDDADSTTDVSSGHAELSQSDGPSSRSRRALSLSDVAGLQSVKQRLESEFLAPARNPQLAERYGKSARGGLLLYGPPGCGKTYIARALAGELAARFMPVDSATVVSAYPGQSAQVVKGFFQEARRNAPSLLFLDEVDAVAMKRDGMKADWLKGMVNQLLAEFDGFRPNDGVFVVGATNAPWDVDPAMRRPGRFDRTVAVLPPDRDARSAIFASHLVGRVVGTVDTDRLAELTSGFSGADVAHVVEGAASIAFERALSSGKEVPIDTSVLLAALRDVNPSTRAWLEQAKNYITFANKDGSLDDLASYMRDKRYL